MSRGFCRYLDMYYDQDDHHSIPIDDLEEQFNSWNTNLGGKAVSVHKIIQWIKKYCSHLYLDDEEKNVSGLRPKDTDLNRSRERKRQHTETSSDIRESSSPTSRTEELIYPVYNMSGSKTIMVSPTAFVDYVYMPVQENGHSVVEKVKEWYDLEFNRLSELQSDYADSSPQRNLIQDLLVQLSVHEPRPAPTRIERISLPTIASLLNNNSVFEELLNRILPPLSDIVHEDEMDETEEFEDVDDEIEIDGDANEDNLNIFPVN